MYKCIFITIAICLMAIFHGAAQVRSISMNELFALAEKNSLDIALARTEMREAAENYRLVKSYRYPSVNVGLSYGYISNTETWAPSFSQHETRPIPHISTQLNLDASWRIYGGGRVTARSKTAALEANMAAWAAEDYKLKIIADALDVCLEILRLRNEVSVYQQNVKLAGNRLRQIQRMNEQGLVTPNDVMRTELSVSELELLIIKTHNQAKMRGYRLAILLGLEGDEITPDSSILRFATGAVSGELMLEADWREHPALKASKSQSEAAAANVKAARADIFPDVSLYASNNLQRPFMVSLPPTDIYFNIWQFGIRLRYNLTGGIQARHAIATAKLQQSRRQQSERLLRQQIGIAVNNALIQYEESRQELVIMEKDLQLALRNYTIVERKYMQRMALITEMSDAANTRVAAEIRLANGKIRVLQQYFYLLRETGTILTIKPE